MPEQNDEFYNDQDSNKEITSYNSDEVINRLYDQENLLDVLIEIESVFDALDLYAFSNWFSGEIVSGPWLKRYWVKIILKYPFKKMPDPYAALRLQKHGARVSYFLTTETVPVEVENPSDLDPRTKKPKTKQEKIWLVTINMPRRFIEDMETGILDLEDEEEQVDLGAAQSAEEEGLDSGYQNDEEGAEENEVY